MFFLAIIAFLTDAAANQNQSDSITHKLSKAQLNGKLLFPSENQTSLIAEPQILMEKSPWNGSEPYLTIKGQVNWSTATLESLSILYHPFYSLPTHSRICNSLEVGINFDFEGILNMEFLLSNGASSTVICEIKTKPTRKLSSYRVQYGKVPLAGTDESGNGIPTTVEFCQEFENPLVIAMITTHHGDASVTCRVNNLNSRGFKVFAQPALRGPYKENHPDEEVGYFAVDLNNLPPEIEGGKVTVSGFRNYKYVYFSSIFSNFFSGPPTLLAFVQTENNPGMVTATIIDHSFLGFRVGLDTLSTGDSVDVSEEVGWIAIPPGRYNFGSVVEFGRTGDEVTDHKFVVQTSHTYSEVPTPLVSLNSLDGGDGGYMRGYLSNSRNEIWFHLQEDQVTSLSRAHTTETVSWMAFLQHQECNYECSTGYYKYESLCLEKCPTGFDAVSGECSQNEDSVLSIEFNDKVDGEVGLELGSNTGIWDVIVHDDEEDDNDPWPAQDRGYYFDFDDYASKSGLMIPPSFSAGFWVRPKVNSGTFFSKQKGNSNFEVGFSSGSIFTRFKLRNGSSVTRSHSESYNDGEWHYVSLKMTLYSNWQSRLSMYFDGTHQGTWNLPSYYYDSSDFDLYFGTPAGSSPFNGFIWSAFISKDPNNYNSDFKTSGCQSPCERCPADGSCPETYEIEKYPTNNNCKPECTHGCVRNDIRCNLCNHQLCYSCSGFNSECSQCIQHASNTDDCTCDRSYYFDTTTEACERCQGGCYDCTGPLILTMGVCNDYCPTGYTKSGGNCNEDTSLDGLIFDFRPHKIEDIVWDQSLDFKVSTGKNTQFYPNQGDYDPYPAKDRGYYFNSNAYMELPPNFLDSSDSLVLNVNFQVSTWIRPDSSGGSIFCKQDKLELDKIICLELAGFYPTLKLTLLDKEMNTAVQPASTRVPKGSWTHIAFQLESSNDVKITWIIDGSSQPSYYLSHMHFADSTMNFLIAIGATHQSDSSMHEFYKGFIYSIKIWNKVYTEALDFTDSGCSSPCSTCPSVDTCIPDCSLAEYWDSSSNSCQLCHHNCQEKGCVRYDQNCNLCSSQLCVYCDNWETCNSDATPCVENASSYPCECNFGYGWDPDTESCTFCEENCLDCSEHNFMSCKACENHVYSLGVLCVTKCPLGYSVSDKECTIGKNSIVFDLQLQKIQGVVYDSASNIPVVTGSSSAFYPHYDSSDPVAAYKRGYYFDGVTSRMQVAPYLEYLSPLLHLAHELTVEVWVNPSQNGVILSKVHSLDAYQVYFQLELTNRYPKVTLLLERKNQVTATCNHQTSLNNWNHLAFNIEIDGSGNTILECSVNQNQGSHNLGFGYYSDEPQNYLMTIGCRQANSQTYTSYFRGFIYSVQVFNTKKSLNSQVTSSCSEGCSVCPIDGNCLVNCGIDEYWTETNYNSCSSCHYNCEKVGCVDSGLSCNLCSDKQCKTCTDYSSSCLECEPYAENTSDCTCQEGYSWNSATETCGGCHSACETCSSFQFTDCSTCKSGSYFLNGVCHPFCPTGTRISGSECTQDHTLVFHMVLNGIKGTVKDLSSSGIEVVTGSSEVFYPNYESDDPRPVKDRGYYFTGASVMQLPPYSEAPLTLSNEFTIKGWLFHISDGVLISKVEESSYASQFQFNLASNPSLAVVLQEAGSVNYACSQTLPYNTWSLFDLRLRISGTQTQVLCRVNGNSASYSNLGSGYFVDLDSNYYFSIGAKRSAGGFESYWKGMLYEIKLWNSHSGSTTIASSVCDSSEFSCSICPSLTNKCLNSCLPNQYWNGECRDCHSSCVTCVRGDSFCNICEDKKCQECSDFTANTCVECKEYSELDNGTCKCADGYAWDETTNKCLECDSKCLTCSALGFLNCIDCKHPYFFYEICLEECPTGTRKNLVTNRCATDFTEVFRLEFEALHGKLTDKAQSEIEVRHGSSWDFYPQLDSEDPIPVYKRGYFFDGTSSVLHLPPYSGNENHLLNLAPDFTIMMWVNLYSGTGTMLSKNLETSPNTAYLAVKLDNRVPLFGLELSSGSFELSSVALDLKTWHHLTFSLDTTTHSGITVKILHNGNTESSQSLRSYWIDLFSSYAFQVGASYPLSNYFNGLIFELSIHNIARTPLISSSCTSNPGSCEVCPLSGECISDCEYNQDLNCRDCKAMCSTCREAQVCNLCEDKICQECESYGTSLCVKCKPNASFVAERCVCHTGYVFVQTSEECENCRDSCDVCEGTLHNQCTQCSAEHFLLMGECLENCPFGYTETNGQCVDGVGVVFDLNLANQIKGELQDSLGFGIETGLGSNFYPDYDSADPVAGDSRGYYFRGSSFIEFSQNSEGEYLVLPPMFTMLLWIRPQSDGTLIAKQDPSDYSNKPFSLSLNSNRVRATAALTNGNSYTKTCSNQLSYGNWHYLVVKLMMDSQGNSKISIETEETEESLQLAVSYFQDKKLPWILGAEYSLPAKDNFYTGFIRSVKIWQSLQSDMSQEVSSACSGGCSACLADGECIPNCNIDQKTPECLDCPSCPGTLSCVSTATCNLCKDSICEVCEDYSATGCTQCKSDSSFSSSGFCECNSGFYWETSTETCKACHEFCVECSGPHLTDCTQCKSEFYYRDNTCLEQCPTGFAASSQECIGTQGLVLSVVFDKIQGKVQDSVNNIEITAGSTETFYPELEEDDPTPAKDRGYYFDGNDFMQFESKLVFNPLFSIGIWIYPQLSGNNLLSKQHSSNSTDHFSIEIDSDNFAKITLKPYLGSTTTYKCTNQLNMLAWNHLGFKLEILNSKSKITCSSNFVEDSGDLGFTYFQDLNSDYSLLLGAKHSSPSAKGSFFKGFIKQLRIWNQAVDFASEDSIGCFGSYTCLVDCDLSEFYDGTCKPCLGSCTKGCVRETDCNLCKDPLCSECSSFSEGTCSACIENADFTGSECKCSSRRYYDESTFACEECSEFCTNCFSKNNGDCLECLDGYFMNNGLCLSVCPSGYTLSGSECLLELDNFAHFKFNRISNEVVDSKSGYIAYIGSSDNYLGNFDSDDAYPAYQRGLYFTGSLVQLPPNPSDSKSIILGNTLSFELWARPESQASNHAILTKHSPSSYFFSFKINQATKTPFAEIKLTNGEDATESAVLVEGPQMANWNTWQHLSLTLERSGNDLKVKVLLNTLAGTPLLQSNSYLHDKASFSFAVGADPVASQSFKGFIYELVFYNSIQNFVLSSLCGCSACSTEGDCLTDCSYLEFLSEGSCVACDPECSSGCVRKDSCTLNLDPNCEEYTGFEYKYCNLCADITQKGKDQCECVANSYFNEALQVCECEQNYFAADGECLPCTYHIQEGDLEAYFSEDYKSLVFNFEYQLASTTSWSCKELFTFPSFSQLGENPACNWNSSMNSLEVKLGAEATILREVITFQKQSLYTDIYSCGDYPGPIGVSVDYKYQFPNHFPAAALSAPLELYKGCFDLQLDARGSSGGYGRPLEFHWDLQGFPEVPYSTGNPYLEFPSELFEKGSVTVGLRVKNWIQKEHAVNYTIQVSENQGIKVNYDSTVSWRMESTSSKSIYVLPESKCEMSSSLSYDWELLAMYGNYCQVHTNFWNKQTIPSRLLIPKNYLKPGIYTFKATIKDNIRSTRGSSAFNLTVYASPLSFVMQEQTNQYVEEDLVVNSLVHDPNELSGDFKFFWTCEVGGTDCSSLIENSESKVLQVPKNTLKESLVYNFTVLAEKDFRSSCKSILVHTKSFPVPSVRFSSLPEYVSNQRTLVIRTFADGNYTYIWELSEGGTYETFSEPDSSTLVIKPWTLQEGTFYKFKLQVHNGFYWTSHFVSFTVNSAPQKGSLKLSHSAGESLNTVFKFSAENWVDPKNPESPLTYQFGYFQGAKEYPLNIKNQSSVFYSVLPADTNLKVFVKVFDKYDCFTMQNASVSVQAAGVNPNSVISYTEELLNSPVDDPNLYPSFIYLLQKTVFTQNSSMHQHQLALDHCFFALEKLKNLITEFDYQNSKVLLSLFESISDSAYIKELGYIETMKTHLDSFLDLQKDSGIRFDNSTFPLFASSLLKTFKLNSTMIKNTPEEFSKLNKYLYNALSLGADSAWRNQRVQFNSPLVQSSSALDSAKELSNSTLKINSAEVTLPDLHKILGDKELLSILVAYESSDIGSLEFSILDHSQSIDLGSESITLKIPLKNSTSPDCVYWKEDSWSNQGCELQKFDGTFAVCKCTHMSLFAAGDSLIDHSILENPPKTPETNTSLLVFYYSLGVVVSWVLFGFAALKCEKTNSQTKVEELNKSSEFLFNKVRRPGDSLEIDDSRPNFNKPGDSIISPSDKSTELNFLGQSRTPVEEFPKPQIETSQTSCWTSNYYIGWAFYSEKFTKAAIVSELFTSLNVQSALIGVWTKWFLEDFGVQEVVVVVCALIASNLFVVSYKFIFFKRSHKLNALGVVVNLVLMGLILVATYNSEVSEDHQVLGCYLVALGVGLDFILIQNLKALCSL